MSYERRSSGDSSDNQDLYNEMLRLEELESLLEEIEEIRAVDSTDLPVELKVRLASLRIADPRELRRRVESLHATLDTVE